MRIAVAMSGGVDSSVAAAVLAEAGADVVGLTMRLLPEPFVTDRMGACCSPRSIAAAARACDRIGAPHYVVDAVEAFENEVMRPYAAGYLDGRTPNPCVLCNEAVKFDLLWRKARALGCEALATGHYARAVRDRAGGRLLAARDPRRDQSYFLYRVPPARLAAILFPLGEVRKADVRAIARRAGLPTAEAPESHEACFAEGGDTARAVRAYAPRPVPDDGPIETPDGREVGRHAGHWRYTVGQRRGLGLSGGPWYIARIEADRGAVVVDHRPPETSAVACADARWIVDVPEAFEATARVRSQDRGAPARIERTGTATFVVEFDRPRRRVAPGQSVVLYDGEEVLGGGVVVA